MRSFLSLILSTAALLIAALLSRTCADETVVDGPQDVSADQTSSDLRPLLQIDDAPQPPLLLGSRFRIPSGETPRAGQRIGRAIVIDRNRHDQHHFELLEGGTHLRIDSGTGEVFLRDEIDPLSVATLRAVVRVKDRAGLSTRAVYPVMLNESPPAPPLPVLLAQTSPTPENAAPTESTSTATTPSQRTAPHQTAEQTPSGQAAAGPRVRRPHTAPVAPAVTSGPAQSRTTGLSWTRGLLSLFGMERYADHSMEWLTVAVVVMCVVVIIISGVRNAVLAGRDPVEASSNPQSTEGVLQQARRPVSERDPQEISEILERLDAVIGRSEHAAGTVESDGDPDSISLSQPEIPSTAGRSAAAAGSDCDAVAIAESDSVDVDDADAPSEPDIDAAAAVAAISTAKSTLEEPAASPAVASSAVRSAPQEASGASEAGGVAVLSAAPSQRGCAMPDDERARIEQFREISRIMNRADIDRRSRQRMRDEWASVGVTSLACVVTGTVCVFTSCFGPMSVPIGSVMFSVATVLLMRPSLYPSPPQDISATPLNAADVRRTQ
jgi:hypothetical protein